MWQLASTQHAVGAALAAVTVLALAASRPDENACRFEQTWYAGDVHFNERIEFRADATGTWISGGMAGDARHDRRAFRWSRTASTLTVTHGDERHDVGYAVRPHRDTCFLTFEAHPVLGGHGFTHFSNRE